MFIHSPLHPLLHSPKVPGNVREQVASYCTELDLPGSVCDQLQRHYLKRFEKEHVNSDEFLDTCKSQHHTDNANLHDYGCKRNGIKVAIVHLATAKGTYIHTLYTFFH